MRQVTKEATYLEAGTAAYRRANLALFIGGFTTFALLYGPQPLLPLLTAHYAVTPASASLSVSAATAALALMLIPASMLSDRHGRALLMQCSLFGSAFFSLLVPLAQDFGHLLILRALLGVAVAGLPAAAMAWIGEEIAPNARGRAMGLYIAGNAFGGMSGRFVTAWIAEWVAWETAFLVLGLLGLAAALLFWKNVPASQHFKPRGSDQGRLATDLLEIVSDPGAKRLFIASFLLMGAFVALYNYLGFRLQASPYHLRQAAVGSIFLLYALGTFASAWAGRLVDRIGRKNVLWVMIALMGLGLALTLFEGLAVIIAGIALFTFGFFGAHSTGSGWVGERARNRRALAAALYLTAYYLGGSVIGSLAGFGWSWDRWTGVATIIAACVLGALWMAKELRRL